MVFVELQGSRRGHDEDFSVGEVLCCGLQRGLNAENRNVGVVLGANFRRSGAGGGVAGNDDRLAALFHHMVCNGDGKLADLPRRFFSVRCIGRVAEVVKVFVRQFFDELLQHT